MQAILNVNSGSAYAKYNGLTFEVKEVLNGIVALKINSNTVDFSFAEVLIVDIKSNCQVQLDLFNHSQPNCFINLNSYCVRNKINASESHKFF